MAEPSESAITTPMPIPFQMIDDDTVFIRVEWGGEYQNIFVAPIEIKGNQIKETMRLVKQSLKELEPPQTN